MADAPYRVVPDGIELAVRLTPRGGRDGIDGVVADASGRALAALRVSAPAVDGAANKALLRYVARSVGLPPSAVRLVRGDSARVKQLHLAGAAGELVPRLAAWLGTPEGGR